MKRLQQSTTRRLVACALLGSLLAGGVPTTVRASSPVVPAVKLGAQVTAIACTAGLVGNVVKKFNDWVESKKIVSRIILEQVEGLVISVAILYAIDCYEGQR